MTDIVIDQPTQTLREAHLRDMANSGRISLDVARSVLATAQVAEPAFAQAAHDKLIPTADTILADGYPVRLPATMVITELGMHNAARAGLISVDLAGQLVAIAESKATGATA